MSGTDLLVELTRRFGPRPALILTADRSEEVRRTCESLGVERMLKPLDRTRLGQFLTEAARAVP